ncbi:MAG: 4-hydroxy-tetrahydrodipicolinate reductase [Phycisphaerae bacterium]
MSKTRVVIVGATGRMGRTLVRLASDDAQLQVVGALGIAGDPLLGQDAGTIAGVRSLAVPIAVECPTDCDVLVDFTSPAGAAHWAAWSAEHRKPIVSGSTGLEAAHHDALRAAAAKTAVLWSPNMSIGVNILLRLVRDAAKLLDADWDIEISESHHRLKADAPSGTARALLEAACEGRSVDPKAVALYGREGIVGARKRGEIGVHALRMGGIVGEHDVHFATPQEHITLSHRAESRDVFAAGALRAAKWIVGIPAGLYHMRDVLA